MTTDTASSGGAVGFAEFARKNVGGNHGERGALSREQRRTERGISNQTNTSSGPFLHPNLAHAVEIQFTTSW